MTRSSNEKVLYKKLNVFHEQKITEVLFEKKTKILPLALMKI